MILYLLAWSIGLEGSIPKGPYIKVLKKKAMAKTFPIIKTTDLASQGKFVSGF